MKNWWKSLKNLSTSVPINKILLVKVAFYLLFFRFALKVLPFKNFKQLYSCIIKTRKTKDYNITQIKEIANAVIAVSENLPLSTACLTQALTTKLLLRSDSEIVLRIGVFIERGFEAHAWVEKKGIYIIGESPLTDYTPIWDWS